MRYTYYKDYNGDIWRVNLNYGVVEYMPISHGGQEFKNAVNFETWEELDNGLEFELTNPKDVIVATRIRLPKKPTKMMIGKEEFADYTWHEKSKTLFFKLAINQQKQAIKIVW